MTTEDKTNANQDQVDYINALISALEQQRNAALSNENKAKAELYMVQKKNKELADMVSHLQEELQNLKHPETDPE